MGSPYRRRRTSLLRNVWVYRRLLLVALVLGLLLWFIWANNEKVTIAFPFGLGHVPGTTGIIILTSFMVGSLTTGLVTTLLWALRVRRSQKTNESSTKSVLDDELPPPDYASKAGEGLANTQWP